MREDEWFQDLRQVLADDLIDLADDDIDDLLDADIADELESLASIARAVGRKVQEYAPVLAKQVMKVAPGALKGAATGLLAGGPAAAVLGAVAGVSGTGPAAPASKEVPAKGAAPTTAAAPAITNPAALQLLLTLFRPEVVEGLMAMALGRLGTPTVDVGATPVPVAAVTNLVQSLAECATAAHRATEARGDVHEYQAEALESYVPAEALLWLLSESEVQLDDDDGLDEDEDLDRAEDVDPVAEMLDRMDIERLGGIDEAVEDEGGDDDEGHDDEGGDDDGEGDDDAPEDGDDDDGDDDRDDGGDDPAPAGSRPRRRRRRRRAARRRRLAGRRRRRRSRRRVARRRGVARRRRSRPARRRAMRRRRNLRHRRRRRTESVLGDASAYGSFDEVVLAYMDVLDAAEAAARPGCSECVTCANDPGSSPARSDAEEVVLGDRVSGTGGGSAPRFTRTLYLLLNDVWKALPPGITDVCIEELDSLFAFVKTAEANHPFQIKQIHPLLMPRTFLLTDSVVAVVQQDPSRYVDGILSAADQNISSWLNKNGFQPVPFSPPRRSAATTATYGDATFRKALIDPVAAAGWKGASLAAVNIAGAVGLQEAIDAFLVNVERSDGQRLDAVRGAKGIRKWSPANIKHWPTGQQTSFGRALARAIARYARYQYVALPADRGLGSTEVMFFRDPDGNAFSSADQGVILTALRNLERDQRRACQTVPVGPIAF